MQLIADRRQLMEALALAAGVCPTRSPKPIMECVKLTARMATEPDPGLTIEATDGELRLKLRTERVEVAEPGEVCLPAAKLLSIVKESIDATITMASDGDVTTVTGSDSRFKVFGMPPGDFPEEAQEAEETAYRIKAGDFNRVIGQALFATANENIRYAINGVLIEHEGSRLTVVATDGHRLAKSGADVIPGEGPQGTTGDIVPAKALTLLTRLMDDADAEVTIMTGAGAMHYKAEGFEVWTSLVEGNFPPYADVIPRGGKIKAMANVDAMVSALRRAALLTNEESKGVRFAFGPDDVVLSSRSPEIGEAEVTIEASGHTGEDLEIGFNPAYVMDGLKAVTGVEVECEMQAPNKPMVLRDGPDFLYVVMPVNLS